MRIFLKRRDEPRSPGPTIHCANKDCNHATRHGKGFCADHIDEMSYAKKLVVEMQRKAKETAQLSRAERLPVNSHLVKEAYALLWEHQKMSAPGLTRHIKLTHAEAEVLLRSLSDHGLASISKSRRGIEAKCSTGPEDIPTTLPS